MKKPIINKILIVLLVVNQCVMFYYNRKLIVKQAKLQDDFEFVTKEINILHKENTFCGMDSRELINNMRLPSDLFSSKKHYMILFCFTESNCTSCMQSTISEINKIYYSSNKKADVVAIIAGTDRINMNDIKRETNIHFPVCSVKNLTEILMKYNINMTPVLFFIDKQNNKIISTVLSKREYYKEGNFFERVKNYLSD